ncbi:DUF2345 domain-containing protein [Massilia sp. S19_KUP03_FR1]|uniref:DUF2345 domain-containing protein n=1 Tax=Massilia sp. S19_KUP03_FR1 TaxID=3025503 RepID=UPI002FCD8845
MTHAARNNLRTGIKGSTALASGTYRNHFACVRDSVALVPPATAAAHPCTVSGTQVALVVGLAGTVATTTRDHQVRVQFPWQRGVRPNPGGLEHGSVSGGNAPGDASCGAWVRVAEGLAGPNWGSQFIPRIGTEVLVAFVEGDIDRPLVVGQLHNGVAPPPFQGGVDAAANHAGVLSGIHTENFDGGGYNQWQLDDTQEQPRTRLVSSSAAAELSLGVLVAQAAGSSTRGASRGSGFELRTDAWVALRGAQGVLVSTSARVAAGTGVTSTQMDVQEAVSLFKGAHALDEALTQSAGQHHALASKDACKAQTDLIALVDPTANGKYDGPVNGQLAAKASAGSREVDAAQPVERFGAPAVLFDAAASMNWATAASTVISAGQQLHWTTQSDLHVAAGSTLSSVAGNNLSLFTHGGGIHAIAANEPVSVEAHTDQLEIVADKEVVALSVNDVIAIQGKAKVVLQAGQSSITLEGGDITFACTGNFTAKGGQHLIDAGAKRSTVLNELPESRVEQVALHVSNHLHDEQIQFKNKNQALLANVKYQVTLDDGTIQTGVTDKEGRTARIVTSESQAIVEATLVPVRQEDCCSARKQPQEALKVKVTEVSTNERDIGTSSVIVQTPEGEARGLTPGEIAEAQSIFFDSIDYSKVKIHNGEYLWFGLQPDDTAMTPNGEMYFNPKEFLPDFSTTIRDTLWFMHEMVHVWQYQLGYWVRFRGAIRIGLDYRYTLDERKNLSSYNMEAQGNILADYWAIKKLGDGAALEIFEKKHKDDISLYEKVLAKFISNPSDKTNLPGG